MGGASSTHREVSENALKCLVGKEATTKRLGVERRII